MSLGVGCTPFETRVDAIHGLTAHAETIGLDRVDVAEGWTHDSLILLAELAARTSRIGLGSGIISVWGRTPATMALAAGADDLNLVLPPGRPEEQLRDVLDYASARRTAA